MPVLGLLSVALQIVLAVHAVQSGRDRQWIYILLIPVIGPAVYIVTQLLPELFSTPAARSAGRRLANAVDPQRELRKRKEELERADTVENRRLLAEECVEAGIFAEAILLYRSCLHGHYEHDAALLMGLAQAQFGAGQIGPCKETLDRLQEAHPGISSQTGHLLYARSLEGLGDLPGAEREYARLVEYAGGEEDRMRYARFLSNLGRIDECRSLCEETLRRARLASKAYRRAQGEWIQVAQKLARSG